MSDDSCSELLLRAGEAYRRVVADPKVFGPGTAQLVARARTDGDPAALVAALRAQAWFERIRLAHHRARALLDEAARLARRHHLNSLLGEVLVTRGAVNHELGRLTSAKRDFEHAAGLIAPEMATELAAQQAALYQNVGRLAEASVLYSGVLTDPRTPPEVRFKAANNLGIIEAECGRPEVALAHFGEAAATAEQVGPAAVALVAGTRAWVTVQAGRLTEGLELFDAAGGLWEAAGLPLGELYAEYADALMDLRLIPEATELAELAVEMFERQGVALMATEAQLRAARLAQLRQDLRGAEAAAELAAARLRRQGRPTWAARVRLIAVEGRLQLGTSSPLDLPVARRAAGTLARAGMRAGAVEAYLCAGRVAAALGRRGAALSAWARAYELSRGAPVLVRVRGRVAAALAARLRHLDGAVLEHSLAGLTDLARHRAALASAELRALASGHGAELGALGLSALARSRSAARVLDWMERTRAAALAVVDPPRAGSADTELGALRAVHAEILAARRAGTEPRHLLARQTAIEHRIRRATWTRRSPAASTATALPTAALRRLLDGQALVEYEVVDGEVLAVVLAPRRARVVRLGPFAPIRDETHALLFALRRLARGAVGSANAARLGAARRSAEHALATLTGALVTALALPEHEGLVVVPSGQLQQVPWSALHTRPVTVAPSAALWARTRLRTCAPDAPVVLVAGPELAGAGAEIDSLRTGYENPTVLVPPDSRVDAVARALHGAGLAHLACHGHIRPDNPTFSSMLLSDGHLTVQELDQRAIAPHRLVLAACESGSDAVYAGNETLGFVSTLLARGTAGLLASSVVVPDWNVVALMQALHAGLRRGLTLAQALHHARAGVDPQDAASFVSVCAFNAFGAA